MNADTATTRLAEKVKYLRALALDVAREICAVVGPLCAPGPDGRPLLKVCGSLRRMKPEVGDVEIVFVPRLQLVRAAELNLFGEVVKPELTVPATHAVLDDLVARRALAKRFKSDGSQTWGRWIRLAVHAATGVPVDFFACAPAAWWNIVACRTGGSRSNIAVASAAIAMGWHWDMSPESPGFKKQKGLGWEWHAVTREAEVFEFVGLEAKKPEDRE